MSRKRPWPLCYRVDGNLSIQRITKITFRQKGLQLLIQILIKSDGLSKYTVSAPPPHHHHPHSNSFVHPRPRPTLKAIYSIVSYCILLHRIVKQVRCPHAHIGHWLTGWEPIQKSTPINLQDHSLYLFSSIVTRLPNTGNDDSVFHEKIYYTCSFINQFGM